MCKPLSYMKTGSRQTDFNSWPFYIYITAFEEPHILSSIIFLYHICGEVAICSSNLFYYIIHNCICTCLSRLFVLYCRPYTHMLMIGLLLSARKRRKLSNSLYLSKIHLLYSRYNSFDLFHRCFLLFL